MVFLSLPARERAAKRVHRLQLRRGPRTEAPSLGDYRLPDNAITQDSVVALGLAVANAHHAHARDSGGRILWKLFYELNGGRPGPRSPSLERQKDTTNGRAFGLIPGHRAPDEKHGRIRLPYQAEVDEVPGLLAQGWTPDDPAILDKLGLQTPTRT